ncbi:MAG: hypothetical protein Q8Q02_08685 [Nocardioides sp.]|nr:hypothetical protein [Nocardioides sp.]
MRASVELLPDAAGEGAVRASWVRLNEAGLPSRLVHQGLSNWPHVTIWESAVHVADRPGARRRGAPEEVLPAPSVLAALLEHLPLAVDVLGTAVFGRSDRGVLVLELDPRPLVPLHEAVRDLAEDGPGGAGLRRDQWRPHLTLSRPLGAGQVDAASALVRAVPLPEAIVLETLRTWDPAANTVNKVQRDHRAG